ncbi:MAG: S66 peptidase family protein [Parcubacteria group bacterium]
MQPKKLQPGDEIRVVAPSRSLSLISQEARNIAEKKLMEMGFKVSYAKNVEEMDEFRSSSIESRVADLHAAFADQNVKGILTSIGGFNVNQLLPYLDYELIKSNPKILCGYSDITALTNAIYAKTGLMTYSGPHFSTFGMTKGIVYTTDYFEKCLLQKESFAIQSSAEWSDDAWYLDQENREFIPNEGMYVINAGEASGALIGGNLCTLNLLQGTEFMPSLKDTILFVEDDDMVGEMFPVSFDRDLQSLLQHVDFKGVRGLVIGRCQKGAQMTREKLIKIIKTKKELANIPVIAGVDFGHTTPQITFPIGGTVYLKAEEGKIALEIREH